MPLRLARRDGLRRQRARHVRDLGDLPLGTRSPERKLRCASSTTPRSIYSSPAPTRRSRWSRCEGAWGWSLFGVVWTLAVLGIVAKTTVGFRYPRLSTALYLGMGWLIVVAIKPLRDNLSAASSPGSLAGGLLYTGGVPFYVWKSRRYTHAVWHLFVLGGVACHFAAVLSLVERAAR